LMWRFISSLASAVGTLAESSPLKSNRVRSTNAAWFECSRGSISYLFLLVCQQPYIPSDKIAVTDEVRRINGYDKQRTGMDMQDTGRCLTVCTLQHMTKYNHCHEFMAPWLIITCSGLHDWIYLESFYNGKRWLYRILRK
jgi:hypothetical protein